MLVGDMSVSNRWHSSFLPSPRKVVRVSSVYCLLSSFPDDFIVYFAKLVKICDTTKFFHSNFYISLFIYSFLYIIHLLLADYLMNSIIISFSTIHYLSFECHFLLLEI